MVTNILSAMHDTIDGLDWMTPATKKKALEKLSTFQVKIGYPDKWKDYSSVKIDRSNYFGDFVAGSKFAVADDWAQIGKPVNRGRWGMTPPTSNAYYNPLMNEIVFPAGILQPPAFSVNYTDAVNYGAIGVVIGHEISHGFDDQGAQFDSTGKLENWWTPDDLTKFQAKTACVVKQFDSFRIDGPEVIHINGKLVLGESIGDLAGLKIAYRAFKKTAQSKSTGKNRWLYARPAVLYRLGTIPGRRHAPGNTKADGAGRPASSREVSRTGTNVEFPAFCRGVPMPGRIGDGSFRRGSLRGLVSQDQWS
jgi:endothelin-converting enzyme/putative endopeptidase